MYIVLNVWYACLQYSFWLLTKYSQTSIIRGTQLSTVYEAET